MWAISLQLTRRFMISGWWFGTFVFFHILGAIIPIDYCFSEGWLNHQPVFSLCWGQLADFQLTFSHTFTYYDQQYLWVFAVFKVSMLSWSCWEPQRLGLAWLFGCFSPWSWPDGDPLIWRGMSRGVESTDSEKDVFFLKHRTGLNGLVDVPFWSILGICFTFSRSWRLYPQDLGDVSPRTSRSIPQHQIALDLTTDGVVYFGALCLVASSLHPTSFLEYPWEEEFFPNISWCFITT